jgi:hypothetical protein
MIRELTPLEDYCYTHDLDLEELRKQECPRMDDCAESGRKSCGGCRWRRER